MGMSYTSITTVTITAVDTDTAPTPSFSSPIQVVNSLLSTSGPYLYYWEGSEKTTDHTGFIQILNGAQSQSLGMHGTASGVYSFAAGSGWPQSGTSPQITITVTGTGTGQDRT